MSGGLQVVPFYIVCDVSRSMRGERIGSINEGLPQLVAEVSEDPVVSEKALVSIVTFATVAKLVVPLCRTTDMGPLPTLIAEGQTNYAKAIELLQETIAEDVRSLKLQGRSVLRPFVYFITDGGPGDAWRRLHDKWVDKTFNPQAPNILCFGVADADADVLRRFSTRFVFMTNQGVSAAAALREVMRYIPASIIATARDAEWRVPIPQSSPNFFVIDTLDN